MTLAVCGLTLAGFHVLRVRMNAGPIAILAPRPMTEPWQPPTAPAIRTTLFRQVHIVDVLKGEADCLKIYSPPDWSRDEHATLMREARAAGLRIGGHLPRNLRAATGGATLLRRTSERGRIETGLRADLLLLDSDPLADIEHVARRSGVMAGGRWMPEAWLQERLPRY